MEVLIVCSIVNNFMIKNLVNKNFFEIFVRFMLWLYCKINGIKSVRKKVYLEYYMILVLIGYDINVI